MWGLRGDRMRPTEVAPLGVPSLRNEGNRMDFDDGKGGATPTTGIQEMALIPPRQQSRRQIRRRCRRRYFPRLGPLCYIPHRSPRLAETASRLKLQQSIGLSMRS